MNARDEYVELVIQDTGNGMPPEVRDRLFTEHAIRTKIVGTGLGTTIVKDAIDVHHGSIRVESEERGGTSFHIFLPRRQSGPATSQTQSSPSLFESGSRR